MHALCAVFAWRLTFGLHNVASNGYHDDTERWTQSQEFVVSISWPENLAFSLLIGDHCKISGGNGRSVLEKSGIQIIMLYTSTLSLKLKGRRYIIMFVESLYMEIDRPPL